MPEFDSFTLLFALTFVGVTIYSIINRILCHRERIAMIKAGMNPFEYHTEEDEEEDEICAPSIH